MNKLMYKKGDHYAEVGRKNFFYRFYIVKKTMTFQTFILGKTAVIKRKSDNKVLARLTSNGTLTVYEGYFWNGPSGPTIDTEDFIIGSIPHDVLYQMLKENMLVDEEYHKRKSGPGLYYISMYEEFKELRLLADVTLETVCIENGMCLFRAKYTYISVRIFGESHCLPNTLKDVL